VQLGGQRGAGLVRLQQVVLGRAVVHQRRTARHDVGVALGDVVGVLALQPVEQRAVAVQVVEVLQQRIAVAWAR
jgi:hypothetical protein